MENQFLFNKLETIDKTDEPLLFERKNRYKVKLTSQYRKNKEFEEKLQVVAETDKSLVADMKMNRIWESTMSRIKGIKVKDNNKLIEKTFKKQRSLKKHQAQKWNKRKVAESMEQKKKSMKRKANIDKRRDDKKANKIKKLRKKNRLITGLQ